MKKLGLAIGLVLVIVLLVVCRKSYKATIVELTAPNQSPLINFPVSPPNVEKKESVNSQVRRNQANFVAQEEEVIERRQPAADQRRLGLSQDVKVGSTELPAEVINGRGWYLATELRARKKDRFSNEGEVVERIGPFVIYKVPAETASADQEELTVIYRPDRHRVAILSGRINIQLTDMAAAEEVAQLYDLVIEARRPEIRYIVARPNISATFLAKADGLSKDKLRVVSVQLETSHQDLVRQ